MHVSDHALLPAQLQHAALHLCTNTGNAFVLHACLA